MVGREESSVSGTHFCHRKRSLFMGKTGRAEVDRQPDPRLNRMASRGPLLSQEGDGPAPSSGGSPEIGSLFQGHGYEGLQDGG
jgi:hypothetical protein